MKKLDSVSKDDLKYKVYLDERKLLVDAEREQSRLFDRAILTLSAGAFGLSLTFIRQIVPNIKSGTMLFLIIAWASFCMSLLLTLISFLTSQYACRRQIEILGVEFLNDNNDTKKEANLKNKEATCTKILNCFSLFFFIVGVISLAIFSIVNLSP